MCGGINNVPVITEKWISKQSNNNINNNNPEIQIENREIHFHPRSIQMTNQILLEQTLELVLELEILKFEIFLSNIIYMA